MRLSRLLAVLTLVAAGLAGPAPAAAQIPFQPNVNVGNMPSICTAFGGTVSREGGLISCPAGDDVITCATADTTDEQCVYRPTRTHLQEDPPLKDACEQKRGTFMEELRYLTCTLRGGTVTLQCPDWWERGVVCGLGWTPSEQPME